MAEVLKWKCVTCNARYGEYVNGCPKCWEKDETRSKVVYDN